MLDLYHHIDLLDRIRKRAEDFDKELDSQSHRADLLLLTNNVEASVKDLYEAIIGNNDARRHRRPQILDKLQELGYVEDNLREDLELFFSIRDEYAHTMGIDNAHRNAEELLAKTSYVKLRSKGYRSWDTMGTRSKIVRVYNALMPTLLRQWNDVMVDKISEEDK